MSEASSPPPDSNPSDGSNDGDDIKLIDKPGENDVLLGRGGATNNHDGNIKFRELVNKHKMRYISSTKTEKPKVAREVVEIWKSMDPPGRFLHKVDVPASESSNLILSQTQWAEVPERKAREKASQCLRERTADVLPFISKIKQEKKPESGSDLVSLQRGNDDAVNNSELRNSLVASIPDEPSSMNNLHRRGSLPLDSTTNSHNNNNHQPFVRRTSTPLVQGDHDDNQNFEIQQLYLRQQEALLRENGGTSQIQMAQALKERQVLEQQKMIIMQQQLAVAQTHIVQQNLMAQQLMMQNSNSQIAPSAIHSGMSSPVVPSPVVSPNPGRQALNINFTQMSLKNPLTGHNNLNLATQQNLVRSGDEGFDAEPFPNYTQSGIADLNKVVNLGQNLEPVVSMSPVDQATPGGEQNLGQTKKEDTELLNDLDDDDHTFEDYEEYDVTLKGSNVVSMPMNDVESLGDSIWQEPLKNSTHHSTERLKGDSGHDPRHGGRNKRGVERTLSNSFNQMSLGSTSFANMNISDMDLSTGGLSRDQKMSAARSVDSNASVMSELTDYEDI